MWPDGCAREEKDMSKTERSESLFERAVRVMPGGVNSPVRAFKAVGGTPRFIQSGAGAFIWDVDGNRYLDFVASWGPLILGHAYPGVCQAIEEALHQGTSFGAPTEREVELAELILEAFPGMDQIRLVNSGTEAVMSAIRLARAYTKRDLIVKFEGCYHGHVDSLLVKAGSGAATLGIPDSPGVPEALSNQTLVLPFNNIEAAIKLFQKHGPEIAAVILEPVPANMGLVLPEPLYLEKLRQLTTEHGALLIFDEVITGFRFSWGGVQSSYGVLPDLTCLGKIIGGGLPVAAYGGRKDIMALVAPEGPVYQAGTLSGNPLAVAAGLTTLRILKEFNPYPRLARLTEGFIAALWEVFTRAGVPVHINHFGSIFTIFFTSQPVTDYESAARSDTQRYAYFFQTMLAEGFYFAPSQFEACFVSAAHTEIDLEQTVAAAKKVL
jgi:glutamate-1-semialdehyde 2,1-aminomutase